VWRWLGRNLGTLLLAFLLALVVWVTAVLSTDPNEERLYPRPVNIEHVGLDPGLLLVDGKPTQAQLTLIAPRSVWNQLLANPDLVRTWVDLSGLGAGEHVVPLHTEVSLAKPVRIINTEPSEAQVVLEPLSSQTFPVNVQVSGEPALGYRKGVPSASPAEVIVTGPESAVSQVVEVRAEMDVTGASDSVERAVPVQAFDKSGREVSGVNISPSSISVNQPVTLLGGYRNVVVKVATTGEVAPGYWLTNISVTPPNVTVFSVNPQQVNALPGFVETNPLDLTGLQDDTDIRATLHLPEGVSLAGEESVLVRLSIAALEGSLPISLPVEVIGLSPELQAIVSPETVELLLTGPLPILNNLSPAGIRVSVNVTGLEPGVYQLTPVVDLLPVQVKVSSIMPEIVQVTIQIAPTSTPTPNLTLRPVTPTLRPSSTPTPTRTPKATPTPTP
jgi:YbbR domain-containing protein